MVQTDPKTRYFWAVDAYVGGETDPVFGPVFTFVADNLAPQVNAGDDAVAWLKDGIATVDLDGTVTDDDPTNVLWTVVSEPNEGMAVLGAETKQDALVTFHATGQYVLQLKADDGEYSGTDTVTINVYANSCEAAKSLPGYAAAARRHQRRLRRQRPGPDHPAIPLARVQRPGLQRPVTSRRIAPLPWSNSWSVDGMNSGRLTRHVGRPDCSFPVCFCPT